LNPESTPLQRKSHRNSFARTAIELKIFSSHVKFNKNNNPSTMQIHLKIAVFFKFNKTSNPLTVQIHLTELRWQELFEDTTKPSGCLQTN